MTKVNVEDYDNKVGFSERANVPIEPRLSMQWFLKYPCVKEAADGRGGACVSMAVPRHVIRRRARSPSYCPHDGDRLGRWLGMT